MYKGCSTDTSRKEEARNYYCATGFSLSGHQAFS